MSREVFSYLKNQYESVFNGETPDNEEFKKLINLMRDMVTNKQDFNFYRNLFEKSLVSRQESVRENYEKRGKRFNLEEHVRHCLKTCVASYFPEFLNPDDV